MAQSNKFNSQFKSANEIKWLKTFSQWIEFSWIEWNWNWVWFSAINDFMIIITVLSYIGWPVLNNNDVGMKLRLDWKDNWRLNEKLTCWPCRIRLCWWNWRINWRINQSEFNFISFPLMKFIDSVDSPNWFIRQFLNNPSQQ